MFLLSKPSQAAVTKFLEERKGDALSYPEIGWTNGCSVPDGYNLDHNRILLGSGEAVFLRAKDAISSWTMFSMDWITLFPAAAPIEAGHDISITVRHFGFYSLSAARIVYQLDTPERFGFAYGTLTAHEEIGEERFSVEFNHETDEVWYDLYAFSRPASFLSRTGYPLSRYLQKAFARDSKIAMFETVAGSINPHQSGNAVVN